eukprot:CAMPEP_0182423750 /NCGR_PEP_ID=MMETSP1167-20130531/9841_1 /TAXON_ID=2988 /ORGANISM="Mallomonas Sp, Strain CCMP3275" /LENGTH=715 /DNA_ID=CAMNT_0024603009 /DNA_START=309 /DNA_END=2453 /DNA_ORIENTATION=-
MGEGTVETTPLPFWQIASVGLAQICESLNINVLFPFLAFMVEDFGFTGDRLGYFAGFLAASFCAAQFCSSILWGILSDRFGRKPVVVVGAVGAAVGMAVFGFSTTYSQAVMGRMLSGLLNGNLGVIKSFLTEITDDSNRGSGFSVMSVAWSLGTIVAPLAGGLLCKPSEKYPHIFSSHSIFHQFPYLLPCLLCVVFNLLSAIVLFVCMTDTITGGTHGRVMKEGGEYDSLPTESEHGTIVYFDTDEEDEEETKIEKQTKGIQESILSSMGSYHRSAISNKVGPGVGNGYIEVCIEEQEVIDSIGTSNVDNSDSSSSSSSGSGSEDQIQVIFQDTETEEHDLEKELKHPDSVPQNAWFQRFVHSLSGIILHRRERTHTHAHTHHHVHKHASDAVLRKPVVLLVTGSYGFMCMAYILYDESLPLLLKDVSSGGFAMTSGDIGTILSCGGIVMLLFTTAFLPTIAKGSKTRLMHFTIILSMPVILLWPLLGTQQALWLSIFSVSYRYTAKMLILSILISMKNCIACISFTSSMILINHCVVGRHLGKVNGLGQTFAALARAVGPALGGVLWSVGVMYHFLFLNFFGVIFCFLLLLYVNSWIPPSLDSALPAEKDISANNTKKNLQSCDEPNIEMSSISRKGMATEGEGPLASSQASSLFSRTLGIRTTADSAASNPPSVEDVSLELSTHSMDDHTDTDYILSGRAEDKKNTAKNYFNW